MSKKSIAVIVGAAAAGAAGLLFVWMRLVAAKVATQMVVTTEPPSTIGVNQGFTFAGVLEDVNGNALASKQIELNVGGIVLTSTTTDANGGWAFELSASSEGTVSLYAEFPGDEQYAGC